ncbi:DUF3043 domain-containing protein [Cellulomonas xiejunii]|uniref:DUF3043 domain-containing protein n=1 Tax=Cellulomonas xiejunii TaxID=2968083 RepID=A0ABY5KMJ6_9CELL|nr:DUF3043 domain-containing protein [Cellulomonas xiejunii]MCC2313253.1 DUF3043 domain-containing protein [Cellulomonas xiejunii]MCC2319950.1 DUF3043 domain-containing protein [Cellulomonas xiejunii]UUI70270.1 DUF3043 domain-containing protein [Cellulomonas xiejunii]
MFGRKQDPPLTVDAPVVDEPPQPTPSGKGRPTPKRKEAEARNKRPLVPADRRAAAREARAKARVQRDLEYQAMRNGDERHMPARDRGPVRRYVRDSIDARWNLGEFFLPFAAFCLVLQLVTAISAPLVAEISLVVLYAYIVTAMFDVAMMWRGLKKRLVAKFGAEALPRGLAMYAVMRAFQLRPMRLPKPRVQHGQHPA